MAHELDPDGKQRDRNDGDSRQLDVVLDHLDLAQVVPEDGDPAGPQHSTDRVGADELASVHLADAGHDGHERAHDGHEPGHHQRLRAMALEERMSAGDVALAEPARVGPIEHRWTEPAADHVPHLVAYERGDRQYGNDERDRREVWQALRLR